MGQWLSLTADATHEVEAIDFISHATREQLNTIDTLVAERHRQLDEEEREQGEEAATGETEAPVASLSAEGKRKNTKSVVDKAEKDGYKLPDFDAPLKKRLPSPSRMLAVGTVEEEKRAKMLARDTALARCQAAADQRARKHLTSTPESSPPPPSTPSPRSPVVIDRRPSIACTFDPPAEKPLSPRSSPRSTMSDGAARVAGNVSTELKKKKARAAAERAARESNLPNFDAPIRKNRNSNYLRDAEL